MRILILVSDMRTGGAERVAATLARGWFEHGFGVHLIATYSLPVESEIPLAGGVKFARLADAPGCAGSDPATYIRRIRELRRMIRSIAPDVTVSLLTNVNVLALCAISGLGIPLVVCERIDPAVETDTGWMLKSLRFVLYPFADGITVQTQRAARSLAVRIACSAEIAVIPNPVPPEIIEMPLRQYDEHARSTVCAAGRLTEQKRFDVLIDAFSMIAGRFTQWDVRIWGDGRLRQELEQRVDGLGLTGRVFLEGRTDQFWERLRDADVFALTSDFEGFPNVLLEAMALGVSCVTSDCRSGPREISADGQAALMVAPGRPDALAAALTRLMSDRALRELLGRNAANFVRKEYSLAAVLHRWDRLFAEVL